MTEKDKLKTQIDVVYDAYKLLSSISIDNKIQNDEIRNSMGTHIEKMVTNQRIKSLDHILNKIYESKTN